MELSHTVSAAHSRSLDAVGATVSYCVAVHSKNAAHWGCEVLVAATDSNSVRKSHGTMAVQLLSELAVGAAVSIWLPAVQVVSVPQARSEVAVAAEDSYSELG